jgi:glycosyltransferase involved in cell wall biosynthesis
MLEYFAAGLPVISTPIGARGLGAKDNDHLIIADFHQFVGAIVSIRNESHEIVSERVENARKLVTDNFTWDIITQRMTDAIQQKEILSF